MNASLSLRNPKPEGPNPERLSRERSGSAFVLEIMPLGPTGRPSLARGLRPQADALGKSTSTNSRPERGARDYHIVTSSERVVTSQEHIVTFGPQFGSDWAMM